MGTRAIGWLRVLAHSRRNPSALLLFVQLASMLLVPFIDRTPLGRACFGAIGVAVLIATIRMVRTTPWLTGVSVAIALPAIALHFLHGAFDLPALLPWSAALEAMFYFYAAGSLTAYMLADQRATSDELFAAGATFTLLAWGFTYTFLFLQLLQPGSFAAAVQPQDPRSWTELMYLSFALLSSTGIGDVIPLTPVARSVSSVAMFVGVMYLATVVSRLIGLTLQQQRRAG